MPYSFDREIDRRGTLSYKWDSADKDVIPLWVADMDFETAPVVKKALQKRVNHGIYGYTRVPDAYYKSVADWFRVRHHWVFDPSWMLYTSGVVPAISAIIKALTHPGDEVIVQSPVFNCFYSSIRNNGCKIVSNDLIYENGTYRIDFADLKEKLSSPKAKNLLLCNPHNPAGRVWTPDELRRIGEICLQNDVWIVSDEIHCEFVSPGYTFVPFGSISPDFIHKTIVCISPSKAFNLGGLQISNIVCENEEVRNKIDRAINDNEVCDVNPFGIVATMAAYTDEGAAWLKDLNSYINSNYLFLCDFFKENLPQFPVTKLEGTYLVWVDCSAIGKDSETIQKELLSSYRVWVNEGVMYGANGNLFIRINIACPRKRLEEGLKRIAKGLKAMLP